MIFNTTSILNNLFSYPTFILVACCLVVLYRGNQLRWIKNPFATAQKANDEAAMKLAELANQCTSREPGKVTLEAATQKMWNNSKKAIEEHRAKDPEAAFATLQEALPPLDERNFQPEIPLKLTYDQAADISVYREAMEDAHFYHSTDLGCVTGIFDGHKGAKVSRYARDQFKERFFDTLRKNEGNVHQTFELLIDEIHKEVEKKYKQKKGEWSAGTTAVICFIDKKTHQIYTATLGDSEANIYRIFDQQLKSIPISCVRDWTSEKDAKRAAVAYGNPEIADLWPTSPNPKDLRFNGFNISRAIGDIKYIGTKDKPGIIHKPKITINQLKKGDILILCCDGLKDYASENEIINVLNTHADNRAMALVKCALKGMEKKNEEKPEIIPKYKDQKKNKKEKVSFSAKEGDNVTILAINVS
jgi:serine/threonine protein phosphatase PrpC